MQSDWERDNATRLSREQNAGAAVVLPAFPRRDALVEIGVSPPGDFHFFIDRQSLSVADGRTVRYAMVARSPNGVENVTYEGIDCAAGQYIVYAVGRDDGRWTQGGTATWRPIDPRAAQRWRMSLQRDYFCPKGIPIGSRSEGLMALDAGGHPLAKGPVAAPSAGR